MFNNSVENVCKGPQGHMSDSGTQNSEADEKQHASQEAWTAQEINSWQLTLQTRGAGLAK